MSIDSSKEGIARCYRLGVRGRAPLLAGQLRAEQASTAGRGPAHGAEDLWRSR